MKRGVGGVALLLTAFAAPSSAWQATATAEAPGEGVLCAFALTSVAAELARQCHAGENPALQADLDNMVSRFEAYVLANSESTPEQVASFRREQGGSGASAEQLCHGEMAGIYPRFAERRAEIIRQTDRLLSRPGPPRWGDCL